MQTGSHTCMGHRGGSMYNIQGAGAPTKISKSSDYRQIFHHVRTHTVKSYAPPRQTHPLVFALAPFLMGQVLHLEGLAILQSHFSFLFCFETFIEIEIYTAVILFFLFVRFLSSLFVYFPLFYGLASMSYNWTPY